ncbi:hypothetical protein [Thermoanaerobacterium sp. DL9XJH110]|uniref:hypothetical protein n=1 Tax=Thermoanaerobacterium sp. DL9XJH110 TaxID=3386643 RepID=UPI003BB64EE0
MSILRSFFFGLGAAALAYMLSPGVKKMARPMLEKGASGVMNLAQKGRETVEGLKRRRGESGDAGEETGRQTIEASYDTTIEQLRQERNRAFNEIKELRNIINQLQSEINELKEKNE